MTKPKSFWAWIAVSSSGQPAFFLGYHPKKSDVKLAYAAKFGHTLKSAGYTAVRIFAVWL